MDLRSTKVKAIEWSKATPTNQKNDNGDLLYEVKNKKRLYTIKELKIIYWFENDWFE
jgi:hypothetical protein